MNDAARPLRTRSPRGAVKDSLDEGALAGHAPAVLLPRDATRRPAEPLDGVARAAARPASAPLEVAAHARRLDHALDARSRRPRRAAGAVLAARAPTPRGRRGA